MCAVLCPDRGSDYLNASFEQAVVHDLRIELTPLPPLCPDGKAIVERLIRELKRRMAASGLVGTYADRPLEPHSKNQERNARAAAVHSLTEVYRVLIEIVIDHNTREHRALRRRKMLVQAGVPPIPQAAYLWGLTNISGLRCAPFTDVEYQRLLLSTGQGSITRTALHFKKRAFLPANEAAFELCSKAALKRRQIAVRFDKTEPFDIYVPSQNMDWPLFRSTIGGEAELSGVSLDEEEALCHQESLLWAHASHESRRKRVDEQTKQQGKLSKPLLHRRVLRIFFRLDARGAKSQAAIGSAGNKQINGEGFGIAIASRMTHAELACQRECSLDIQDWPLLLHVDRVRAALDQVEVGRFQF